MAKKTATNKKTDVIDCLFNSLDVNAKGFIRKRDFIDALSIKGILKSDTRIKETLGGLAKYKDGDGLSREVFRKIISPNITLIERALTGRLVIPDFRNFCSFITNIFNRTIQNKEGTLSDYIPQLKSANPEHYAVSVCTVDGQIFNLGDHGVPYLSHATYAPVNYCIALEEHGELEVHKKIGKAPKEKGFDEFMINRDGLPHNPLNDAGAIICSTLIKPELNVGKRVAYIKEKWESLAGGMRLGFNENAYAQAQKAADKDFVLAYFMKQKKILSKDSSIANCLNLVFQCLSFEVTTEVQSIVAATLANAGVCPVNGQKILGIETAKNCLSLLYSCGMGDYSAEFAFSVGLPAKSGLSGSIMLVIPNVMGIAVWSPSIDADGNSVRGLDFCKKLIQRFNFHNYDSLTKIGDRVDPRLLKNEVKMKGVMAVIDAASRGDLYEIQRLVATGVDLNEGDYDRRTPLHLAASEGKLHIVDYLIAKNVDVSPKDRWGGSPLADAKRGGHAKIITLLKTHGAQLYEPKLYKPGEIKLIGSMESALTVCWAAAQGDLHEIQRLVASGVDLNSTDYDGRTGIHLAASEGQEHIVRFLIAKGVTRNPKDRWGGSPLDDAQRGNHIKVIELLKK